MLGHSLSISAWLGWLRLHRPWQGRGGQLWSRVLWQRERSVCSACTYQQCFPESMIGAWLPWSFLHSQEQPRKCRYRQFWAWRSCSCWCCAVRGCSCLLLICSFSWRGSIHYLFRIFMRFFFGFSPRLTFCLMLCTVGLSSLKILCILSILECTCCVHLLFYICCLLVEVSCLASLAGLVTLYAVEVCFSWVVPSFGEFVVGGSLFEKLDGLFCSFGFVADDVAEEGAWVWWCLPLSFFWAYL